MDPGLLTAIGAVILAAAGLYRQLTVDPRSSRIAERKENAELRREVDQLYNEKRDAEARERDALRRLDRAERKLEIVEQEVLDLKKDRDKWMRLANER